MHTQHTAARTQHTAARTQHTTAHTQHKTHTVDHISFNTEVQCKSLVESLNSKGTPTHAKAHTKVMTQHTTLLQTSELKNVFESVKTLNSKGESGTTDVHA